MKTRFKLYMRKWIFVFFLIVVIEIFDDTTTRIFQNDGFLSVMLDLFFFLAKLSVIFLLLKRIGKTTEELQKSKKRLDHIFDTLDVAIWSHDLKTDTLYINAGIEKLYGRSSEEFNEDVELWRKVIHPDDLPILEKRAKQLVLGEPVTSNYRIYRPNGDVRWIQDRGIPTLDEQGQFVDFSSVLFDITDRKESEERYRSLVEMSPDIIAVYGNGKIEYINEGGSKIFGANTPMEMIGQPVSKFISKQILEDLKPEETKGYELGEIKRFEFEMLKLDGTKIEVEMSTMPIIIGGRQARQVVGRDITERKKAEKTIQNMAFYDSLTGLPNRNKFRQELNEVLAQTDTTRLAVLFLDLDRFKIINDTKGHTVGDLLLKQVANRLALAVQKDGIVSRHGGDEFIILLKDMDKVQVTEMAERILHEFSMPLQFSNQEFYVTPSIGISLFPSDGTDEETLIKLADMAMYLAKERGKNNFQFYSSHLKGISSQKMELENGLRKALDHNQFFLHYQPQVEIGTGNIIGVEALVRWQHPEYGLIPPNEFISLAEETGLIVPLGKWILKKACEQNKAWQNAGTAKIPVAVNISVRQLQDDHFVDAVAQILKESGLESQFLELEITESVMYNIERSTVVLNELKQLGVKIAIDDFGTGYSSLSYLKHLPIDKIKIDKSFVDDIVNHSSQGAIVKTIIDMGNNLNYTVIAEGIETEGQVQFLKENSCKIGQGFYYSQPLPDWEITNLLMN